MLLTRLPLCIATAFDLHVLGLPPAFVLSQDQTLKLKVSILDRLGGYSPRILRNGHLHTSTHMTRIASHPARLVMAYETQSRQSFVDPLHPEGLQRSR